MAFIIFWFFTFIERESFADCKEIGDNNVFCYVCCE